MSSLFNTTPAFGATSSTFGTPTANLPFGTSAPSQQPAAGFSFGSTPSTAAAPSTGFSFGTPATANTGFGLNTSTAQPAAAANLSFGAPSTNPGFSFGTSTAAAAPSFGAPAAQAPKPVGLTFGTAATQTSTLGGGFGLSTAATSTTPSGFSFGAPTATTTTAPSLGLSFGTPASGGLSFGTSTSTPSFNFGLGSNTASTAQPTLNFGLGTSQPAAVTTAASAPVGLGGIAALPNAKTASDQSKTEHSAREEHLPNELQQTVDNFKNFVKQQKTYSSDIARYSLKEFTKVEADINNVTALLAEVEKQLQTNKNTAEKLKYDTARGLQQVEIAQRTFDTPIGLQYDNAAPLNFFLELTEQFEKDMQNLKAQIENTDKFVKKNGKSVPLTSQDLVQGMRRIHDTFVALAGRLQAVHSQVEAQKEEYLTVRRSFNETTNVFETNQQENVNPIEKILRFAANQPPTLASGPTPFGNITHPSVVQAASQSHPPAYQASTNTFGGFGSTFGSPQQNTSLFGGSTNTTFGLGSNSTFGVGNTTGFSLQKPPSGTKRGKQ